MDDKYKEAGVSVQAGYESVELIKKHVAKTNNLGSISNLGGFGALFDFQKYQYNDPLLVSGTDGVGTKVELAKELNIYDTVGIDLVAMCVNDIITIGAKPLFFLDYIAVDHNIPQRIEKIVSGISKGLQMCDCALIGGETAEMPGVYKKNGFDLAGFVTGIVERDKVIDGSKVKPNQIIIGLPSTGIHSNGYSLVRKIIKEAKLNLNEKYPELSKSMTLGEVLLTPTAIYVNDILNLLNHVDVAGLSHITGGGFYENVKRVTNEYGAIFKLSDLSILPIFNFLKDKGNLDLKEMFGYFNMGIGMMIVVDEINVDKTLSLLKNATVIGKVSESGDIVVC